MRPPADHSNARIRPTLAVVRRSAACFDAGATPPALGRVQAAPLRPFGHRFEHRPIRSEHPATSATCPRPTMGSPARVRPSRALHRFDGAASPTQDDAIQSLDEDSAATRMRALSSNRRPVYVALARRSRWHQEYLPDGPGSATRVSTIARRPARARPPADAADPPRPADTTAQPSCRPRSACERRMAALHGPGARSRPRAVTVGAQRIWARHPVYHPRRTTHPRGVCGLRRALGAISQPGSGGGSPSSRLFTVSATRTRAGPAIDGASFRSHSTRPRASSNIAARTHSGGKP